jgi:hypothetical protein
MNYRTGKLFVSPFVSANLLVADAKLPSVSDNSQLIYFFPPVFSRMVASLFPNAETTIARSPSEESIFGVARIRLGEVRALGRSIDNKQLSVILSKIARFYDDEASVDGETGPRRKLLGDETRTLLDRARQLNAGVRY